MTKQMRELALVGAQYRLSELAEEARQLRRKFPELRQTSSNRPPDRASDGPRVTRSQKHRSKLSRGMRRYWRERHRRERAAAKEAK